MGYAVAHEQTLETEECCSCGVVFAMPRSLQKQLRNNHAYFYCPVGHSQHYTGETETERLRKLLEESTRSKTALIEEKARVEAERDKLAKQARRIKRGVCPCCKRNFVELGRHMKTKHPEYAKP